MGIWVADVRRPCLCGSTEFHVHPESLDINCAECGIHYSTAAKNPVAVPRYVLRDEAKSDYTGALYSNGN